LWAVVVAVVVADMRQRLPAAVVVAVDLAER
jgi:hypothetical protein